MILISSEREVQDNSVLVIFVSKEKLPKVADYPISDFDFKGNRKEILDLKAFKNYKRVILVGLGETVSIQEKTFMNMAGQVADLLSNDEKIYIQVFADFDLSKVQENIYLGINLKSWHFDKYISNEQDRKSYKIKELIFVYDKEIKTDFENIKAIVVGVNLARELIAEPANVLFPKTYIDKILELKQVGLEIEILEQKDLEKLGMGALLSASLGSSKAPYVAIIKYNGNQTQEKPLVLVGKGVTYDTGGYSLKPAAAMMDMKKDMAGSASVVGLMKTLALRKAKVKAIGIVGLVENCVSGEAIKPGDIVKSMSSKTIEVLNTDAEGRMVLADLLWYAQKNYNPDCMINLATLTGAIIISLGGERAGLFSNNNDLIAKIEKAADQTGELVWNMPLGEEYSTHLKSTIADLQNVSLAMKGAGSIFAAMFLKEFVNDYPWAHLDIAGVSSNNSPTGIDRKGIVAFGVRLLNQFIIDNYEKEIVSR